MWTLVAQSMAATDVQILDTFDSLTGEWSALADRLEAAPYLYPGWHRAWQAAFGVGALRILAARRGDHLVGVLPMEVRRGSLSAPTNAHTPGFDILALDEEAARSLAAALFEMRRLHLSIHPVDADGQALRALSATAAAHGYRTLVQPTGRAPYLRLAQDVHGHESALSRNLRHDVRRRFRRLCETGSVSIEVSDGRARLEDLLREGFDVEAKSWKGRRGTAIAAQDDTTRFYRELAQWAADAGWLRLAFLRLDGRAIAFQFDLEPGLNYYSLKIGYDPAFERFSPGKLLVYTMVARAVAHGFPAYELLGRDEPWKERWTDTSRAQVSFHAFSPSPRGRLAESTFVHGKRIAQRMPIAERLAAALRR
jgi:CelD/BcsL family acetyltransferase involved in cellulose biosynthesis